VASFRGSEFARSTSRDPVFMRDFALEMEPCKADGSPCFACLIPDAIRRLIGALLSLPEAGAPAGGIARVSGLGITE
jgi:hypothetical protein